MISITATGSPEKFLIWPNVVEVGLPVRSPSMKISSPPSARFIMSMVGDGFVHGRRERLHGVVADLMDRDIDTETSLHRLDEGLTERCADIHRAEHGAAVEDRRWCRKC